MCVCVCVVQRTMAVYETLNQLSAYHFIDLSTSIYPLEMLCRYLSIRLSSLVSLGRPLSFYTLACMRCVCACILSISRKLKPNHSKGEANSHESMHAKCK